MNITVCPPCGDIKGVTMNGYIAFKGIPFGRAERFCPSEAVARWENVLECTEFGPRPPQPTAGFLTFESGIPPISEDCLNLNVYTPDVNGKRPVLVYFYGGAFVVGSNQDPGRCDPTGWMQRSGVLFVTINYRVGPFGFMYVGHKLGEKYHSSGNCGLSDQILGLEWVKKNIAAFGGDPDRITIFGSSAGAKSVGALIASRKTKGLYHQAIMCSGGIQAIRTPETAAKLTDIYLSFLEKPEELLTLPMETLVEAADKFGKSRANTCSYGPVSDGIFIDKDWRDYINGENCWKGNVLTGCSYRELGPMGKSDFAETAPKRAYELLGTNSEYTIKAAHEMLKPEMTQEEVDEVWVRVLSDSMYRTHTYRLAQWMTEKGIKVWQYECDFPPAHHIMEMSLMQKNHRRRRGPMGDIYTPEMLNLADARGEAIRDMMHAFVVNGDPNCDAMPKDWKPLSEGGKRMGIGIELRFIENGEMPALENFPDIAIEL